MTPESWARAQELILAIFNLVGAATVVAGAILSFVGPGIRGYMVNSRSEGIREKSLLERTQAQTRDGTPDWDNAELRLRVALLEAKSEPTRKETLPERLGLGLLYVGAVVILISSGLQWIRVSG